MFISCGMVIASTVTGWRQQQFIKNENKALRSYEQDFLELEMLDEPRNNQAAMEIFDKVNFCQKLNL